MKKIIVPTLVLGSMLFFVITGCEKDITLIIKPEPVEITDTVSFTHDLVPLFAANCALSGCHADGGHVPVLTPAKAYNSLIGGNYVDKAAPENSTLYRWLTGQLSPPMPMGRPNNPSDINDKVLAWIKQGAQKN
jgi:hypothetical protein